MDAVIQFFQDLMTLFFGTLTLITIVVLIVLISVEVYDFVTGNTGSDEEEQ